MSWQAMEAVQDHSQIESHTGICVMYAIARHADSEGIVGSGGRLTSPSITTLAEKARVSRRTLLNWIPKLEGSGELEVERFGKGRGSWNKYTINLPMPDSIGEDTVHHKGGSIGEDTAQELKGMVQDLTVLVKGMVHYGEAWDSLDTEKDTEVDTSYTDTDEEIIELAHHFENETGFPLPDLRSDKWRIDWDMPLKAIRKRAGGDMKLSKTLITGGIAVNRGDNEQGKRYHVSTPNSIMASALNLPMSVSNGHKAYTPEDESGGIYI